MFRKSAVALALLLLTLSSRLYALGLGEIDMQSALNQPMNANISLVSVAGVDISQVKVKIASREAHERLGLSRAKILSDFMFAIVEDGNGKPVIHISSSDLVREPYLEFLLEMVWENGQMVREYTVLVDPPVTMQAAPVAPVAPVVRAPEPAPARAEPVTQARPAPLPRQAPSTYTPAPVERKTADQYGPVRRDEALWSLAKRLRPDRDISVHQMMIALQRANPHAFVNNNINNLKAGATLKVPDRNVILELNRAQARAEAGRQYKEWKEKRNAGKVATKEPVAETPVAETPVADVPVEDTPAGAPVVVAETEARLKLTPPEGGAVAASASGSEAGNPDPEASGEKSIQQQLALASEEIEAGRAQSAELHSRVLELEAQIGKMQRLLELKSEELASIQGQSAIQAAEPGVSEEAAGSQDEVPADDNEMSAATETGDVTEETGVVPDDAAGVTDGDSSVSGPRGIVDRLIDNPVLAGLGVLVAMLLGGFLWSSRRQPSSKGMFDDEMTLDKHLSGASPEASTSSEPVLNISDPGRFDEAAPESLETSASDGATDPITEADVYLAYGRIQQAEDVLQAALRDDPGNLAVRGKLLSVYHAAGNVAAFDSAASEFRESVPEDDSHWKKIAALGYELSPGNELYHSAKPGAGEDENVSDFDMDLYGLDGVSSRAAMTADEDAGDLGLNMDAEASEAEHLPESIEFTLDDALEDEAQSEGLLASTDEVATKLDLARAYLDMEDPEGARSILQEVLEEGNEEQKNEAESLISNIA
jgi:pilus assembly protein FimV